MDHLEEGFKLLAANEGGDELLKAYQKYLKKMSTQPATAKHHHNYPGGILDHLQQSCRVANNIYANFVDEVGLELNFGIMSVLKVLFVAALEKVDKYDVVERPGKSSQITIASDWTVDPYARAVSVAAKENIFLNEDELHALTFIRGGWSEFNKYSVDLSALASIVHAADLVASTFFATKPQTNGDAAL